MIKIFVFDTNSLISANLSPDSVNRKAYERAQEIGITVHSESTFLEFSEVLTRPKFDKYISNQKRQQEISAFERKSQLIKISSKISICRDPKDNKFLELAIDSGAACIITGDKDLLVLNPFEGIPILTAADFLKAF
ncbi:putative toxin-antitoxin system toxin component, PIN family [uncultured Mucilaginibacter sp.]|uniref:putative toxin-antitoxin system toxin component, PIN family n=1 Tax=uncultured Mucilaginibacter sp. TaxID=797541 RepID=UPI0025FA8156|nr:putative toxin-antitoxin system toxin component, PIN family [uncultured Mucilaginibacter sp.]